MPHSRRAFLGAGALGLVGATAEAEQQPSRIDCLDYGRSFICGTARVNAVRFWVESRTTVFDDSNSTVHQYYQCASCKSENTFAKDHLFSEDTYDFLPILGDGEWLIFRRPAAISETYRRVQKLEEVWGTPDFKLHAARSPVVLETFEDIRDATAEGIPLVTQTEIADEQTGLRAVIECPTKTMNIGLDIEMYQVDTGPVAFPDLSKTYEKPIECLSLAFIAFNAPHFADFVVEQPTSVEKEGQEEYRIYHYSGPFSLPARNRVIALT